jgi:hypothetical protein
MKKFDIKKDRKKLSDEEIQQQMNFDKFISGYTPAKVWFAKGTKFYGLLSSTIAVLTVAGYMALHSQKKETATSLEPFINPPIASLDKPTETFFCNNLNDTTLIYSTGTLVNIPESAFVDENGNDIKGAIQLKYREFHDPIDILFGGIPMTYDSANVHYEFESAGMFEVAAFQNGMPLKLKPGKEIRVNMVSHTNNEKEYNIYYLDTVKRQWNYISENTESNKTCIPLFEKNDRYAKKMNANNALNELSKPVLPKKENVSAYNFIIDFKKEEFPELAVFNGLKFEPTENKKKFHASLAQKTWDDVVIKRDDDNEHYIITFSSEKESHKIKALPVVDEKNYAATMNEYAKRQKLYEAFLAEKKKLAIEKSDSLYRINEIYSGIAQKSDLNERLNNFINNSFMEASKDLLAYRVFTISKLGIWNSDKSFHFFNSQNNVDHFAKFIDTENKPLLLKSVSLIRRSINSIYSVSENAFQHFPFGEEIDVIVGIGHNNEVYYIKDEELRSVDAKKEMLQFKMKQPNGITKPEDLKSFLKI